MAVRAENVHPFEKSDPPGRSVMWAWSAHSDSRYTFLRSTSGTV